MYNPIEKIEKYRKNIEKNIEKNRKTLKRFEKRSPHSYKIIIVTRKNLENIQMQVQLR